LEQISLPAEAHSISNEHHKQWRVVFIVIFNILKREIIYFERANPAD